MKTFPTREEWLRARTNTIGGSDIAAAAGISKWKSNVQLWKEKTGRVKPEEIRNTVVEYGIKAEEHLRELFRLDFPEYRLFYEPNNLWKNEKYPWAHASLDSWLKDERDRFGVLEIKTAMINSKAAADEWKDRIPDAYYAQLLWNMLVTEADFGFLTAQLKYERDDDMYKITRHYRIEASERRGDMEFFAGVGRGFWGLVESGTEPPLQLPDL